jgi:predicted RND superfamily exporter protein
VRPKRARLILLTAGVLGLVSVRSVAQISFDLNPLRLQAANAEAVVWEQKLVAHAERSLLDAAAFAASPEEVRVKAEALKQLPVVADVESILTFLPERQEEKLPVLRSLLSALPDLRMPEGAGRSSTQDVQDLADLLERIRFKMREGEAQRGGAEPSLRAQIERVYILTEQIVAALHDAPRVVEQLTAYRRHFQRDLMGLWRFLRQAASVPAMEVEHVPQPLRSRYYHDGQYLLRIYPKESVWEPDTLHRFVQQIQRVDPHVAGYAVSLYAFAAAFRRACLMASLYAMLALCILLVVHFRSVILTGIAFVPLVMGSLWTVAIMERAGVSFNLANSLFLPLILGAGVEYGVVILSRWREGSMLPGHLPLSTGKGVVLAALSTTVGFGALMVSHHRGIFSLGFVAWSGSLCVLLAAVVLLPAMLAHVQPPTSNMSQA